MLCEHYMVLPVSSGGFGGDIGEAFCQLFAVLVKIDTQKPTISCVCGRRGVAVGWSNGVQLLQVGGGCALIWLLSYSFL